MVFRNIELHNVAELVKGPSEGGYVMLRVPQSVRDNLGDGGKMQTIGGTGVELRFQINSPEGAFITLRTKSDLGLLRNLPVFYGNIGAGWQEAVKGISNMPTRIHIAPPSDLKKLDAIREAGHYGFDPRVVRIILPVGHYEIFSVDGDVTPPRRDQLPEKRMLAYGSSITHGSLSLLPMQSYAQRIANRLGCDLFNKGFAGSALLEGAMADYLSDLDDWDFATLELGVNALGLDNDEFEKRTRYFIKTMAKNPDRKIFCTDIFFNSSDMGDHTKSDAFRAIVKRTVEEFALPNVYYKAGLELSPLGAAGLSGDFVHPNQFGHESIGDAWAAYIRENL